MKVLDLINDYVKVGNYKGLLSKIHHNSQLHHDITEIIKERFYDDISISEGLYRIINDISSRPICLNCNNSVKFKNINIGYFKTCSPKCSQLLKSTQEKRRLTCNIKYGHDHYSKTTEFKEFLIDKCNNNQIGFTSAGYMNYLKNNKVLNASQIPSVNAKIRNSINNRTKEETSNILHKQKTTLMTRYGVHNAYQLARHFLYHEYILPSGKCIKMQGYENVVMSKLLEIYNEDEIIYDKKLVPHIKYFYDNKLRTYYPDFYIPKDNLIIEVKSEWTFNVNKEKVLLKLKAAKECFNSYILICSKNQILYRIDE